MSWFKQHVGLDFIDLAIQVFVTGLAMGFVDSLVRGPEGEALMFLVPAASAALFAVRRRAALKRAADESVGLTTGQMAAARLEDVEQRVAELELANARIGELEERLDFAERLLAQGTGERAIPPGDRQS